MRFSPSLLAAPVLLAALVAAAGCDTIEPPVETGPVIEFGAASVSATEGDRQVEIPVTLTDGESGQSYTVEVLLAAASSSATFGADVDDFGTAAGPNRVQTVTLTGPTDTQVVTIDVLDDTDLEAPEAIVFALQRPTGATVGAARQLRLEIGTPPIATARAREVGTVVTVEGVVTRARGRVSFIQDATAAIGTFAPTTTPYGAAIASGAVAQGDRVQIKGELQEFNSLLQIGNIESFNVLSRGNALPAAQTVTLSQIATSGDALESELVRVTGLTLTTGDVVFTTNTSYDATAGGTTATLRTSSDSEIVGEAIQPITGGAPGAYGPFTFTGVLGQFRDTNQLNPIRTSDFSR